MESTFVKDTRPLQAGDRVVLFAPPGEARGYSNDDYANPYVQFIVPEGSEMSELEASDWSVVVGTVRVVGQDIAGNRNPVVLAKTFKEQNLPIPSRYDNVALALVVWDGRGDASYIASPLDSELWHFADFEKYRRWFDEKKALGAGFKTEELDKVILSDENRKAIVSVLKQHQHSRKIFDTWGLGDVMTYGRGMTMLFHGPPGTGKTWAAECIAKAMSKPLKIVDTAQVQSSEPGGMERALQAVFAEAKRKKEIVFIDEADSMIQSRDGMGQIMSAENNCLLKEVEKFEGILILATNRINELDSALERRISMILEFPEPNEEQRVSIWKRFLPPQLPLEPEVTPEVLAVHQLTGGFIKNVVLGAARLAVSEDAKALSLQHFLDSIATVRKSNKAFSQPSKQLHGIIKEGIQNGAIGKAIDRSRMKQEIEMDESEADKILEEVSPMPNKKKPKPST